jgi:hypothetical protein
MAGVDPGRRRSLAISDEMFSLSLFVEADRTDRGAGVNVTDVELRQHGARPAVREVANPRNLEAHLLRLHRGGGVGSLRFAILTYLLWLTKIRS